MKNFKSTGFAGAILLLSLTAGSCGSDTGKVSAEDEVRAYGKNFVEKLNANQLDSLSVIYPGIANADSLVKVPGDTVRVAEASPGKFVVILDDGVILDVNRSDDGNISVAGSRGLFVFPEEKLDLAKQTGMVPDSLNDVQTSERLKDDAYFDYIKKKYSSSDPYKIKIIPGKFSTKQSDYSEGWKATMTVTIQNLSNERISGNDYSIAYKSKEWGGGSENPKAVEKNLTAKGVDLVPEGASTITVTRQDADKFYDFKVEPTPGREAAIRDNSTYTGNEYQDYLSSK